MTFYVFFEILHTFSRTLDMERTRFRWTTSGGFPHEVPTPNNQDPLARSHQELRGRCAHRSRSGVGSHRTPPKLRLLSHCQAFWRHAIPPSTPVSCRSESRPSPWPKLEESSMVVPTTDGLSSYAGTATSRHQLTCGEDPPQVVVREWRYGPWRLRRWRWRRRRRRGWTPTSAVQCKIQTWTWFGLSSVESVVTFPVIMNYE